MDVKIQNEGSIVLFELISPEAQGWWAEYVGEGQSWGSRKVVEWRYADDIIGGLVDYGFTVGP